MNVNYQHEIYGPEGGGALNGGLSKRNLTRSYARKLKLQENHGKHTTIRSTTAIGF